MPSSWWLCVQLHGPRDVGDTVWVFICQRIVCRSDILAVWLANTDADCDGNRHTELDADVDNRPHAHCDVVADPISKPNTVAQPGDVTVADDFSQYDA